MGATPTKKARSLADPVGSDTFVIGYLLVEKTTSVSQIVTESLYRAIIG